MQFRKIILPFSIRRPVLSLGADLKNTLCSGYGHLAFMSELIGDLSQIDNFDRFRKTLQLMSQRFKRKPGIIAYDLHPGYQSSRYAHQLSVTGFKLLAIQHHHAHICSCMVDNGLKNQKVIGVALDGTGFGQDRTLWGAEFLVSNYTGFRRAGYLRYIPLLGAERAIIEPWRLAAAWLYTIYQDKFLKFKIDFARRIDREKWFILKKMLMANFNSPPASSMGRLFDAISALILRKFSVRYEGQAAIELEKAAAKFLYRSSHSPLVRKVKTGYGFDVKKERGEYIIDPTGVFKSVVRELKNNKSEEQIAYRFHATVAEMIEKVCLKLRHSTKLNKVVLSGGVFQNKILLNLVLDLLYKDGFDVFSHKYLSTNDSSISLGQAAAANFRD